MSAAQLTGPEQQTIRSPKPAVIVLLAAAVLFLGSAAVQHQASLHRWAVFAASRPASESFGEDHLYDYYFPLDPWEQIASTAQLFGAGILVQAVGVLAMASGVLLVPNVAKGRHAMVAVGEFALVLLIAATFAVLGTHALISGIDGVPSPLQNTWTLGYLGFLGLAVLAKLWWRRLPAASAACLFLIGSTLIGYFVSSYVIAPIIAGGTSHDTTRWTETVVAASTAAAAAALILGARTLLWPQRRKRRPLHRL